MLKAISLIVTIGAMSALVAVDASALPITPAKQLPVESNVTLVRDGCGQGMRYSNNRQRCVEQSGQGPQIRVYRDDRRGYGRDRDDDAAEAIGGIVGAIIGGSGRHYHRGW